MKQGIIAASVAGALAIGYVGGNIYASSQAKEALDEGVASLVALGAQATYSDVSANIFGDIQIEDIKVSFQKNNFLADSIEIFGVDPNADAIDGEMGLVIEGFRIKTTSRVDETPDNPGEALHYLMENKELPVDMQIFLYADNDEKELSIEELSLSGDGIGELTLSLDLFGQSLDANALNTLSSSAIKVGEMSLSYEDDGMIDTLFLGKSKDIDEAKEEFVAKAEEALDKEKDEFMKEFINAALSVVDGNKVTLTRDSSDPIDINFAQLSGKRNQQKFVKDLFENGDLELDY